MPDLTIETYAVCESVVGPKTIKVKGSNGKEYTVSGLFVNSMDPSCTCFAYKFSKNRNCKHIDQARDSVCGWQEFLHEPQEKEGVCPRCGGPTTFERYAV